jgi:uncharacterized protein YndB with AHSA1/START domain
VPEPPSATRTLEHEIRIEAPPEAIFPYFTDPAKMVRWMGNEATIDPRPGGICRVKMIRGIGEAAMIGEFVEVVPNSRIVLDWGWEQGLFGVPPSSTRVEISLIPDGTGTLVRLVHSELSEKGAEVHEAGWPNYLERLSLAVAGQDPGPDEWMAPGLSEA